MKQETSAGSLWSRSFGCALTPREVAVMFVNDYFDEPAKVGPVVPDGPCLLGDQRYAFRLRDGRHLYSLRLDIEGVWTVTVKQEEAVNGD